MTLEQGGWTAVLCYFILVLFFAFFPVKYSTLCLYRGRNFHLLKSIWSMQWIIILSSISSVRSLISKTLKLKKDMLKGWKCNSILNYSFMGNKSLRKRERKKKSRTRRKKNRAWPQIFKDQYNYMGHLNKHYLWKKRIKSMKVKRVCIFF